MATIAEVQARFVAELESKGIVHALEWIDGWYSELAKAELDQAITAQLGNWKTDREARQMFLEDELVGHSRYATNKSNLEGASLLRNARIAAAAKALEQTRGPGRDARWTAINERLGHQESAK